MSGVALSKYSSLVWRSGNLGAVYMVSGTRDTLTFICSNNRLIRYMALTAMQPHKPGSLYLRGLWLPWSSKENSVDVWRVKYYSSLFLPEIKVKIKIRAKFAKKHSYVTRMYSYVTRMYLYVTRMYSYVTRIYLYVTRMYSCGTQIFWVRNKNRADEPRDEC